MAVSGTRRNLYALYKATEELGPWSAGLVTSIDASELPPNAMAELTNYIVKDSGYLRVRPQIIDTSLSANAFPLQVSSGSSGQVYSQSLGSVTTAGGALVPIVCVTTNVHNNTGPTDNYTLTFYKWSETNQVWTTCFAPLSTGALSSSVNPWGFSFPVGIVQYANNFYLALRTGLYSATSISGTWTSITASPGWGYHLGVNTNAIIPLLGMEICQNRLFVVDAEGFYYSKALTPAVFTASAGNGGFFSTVSDDGDLNQDFCVFNGDLYIFKTRSIWRLQFTSDPAGSSGGIYQRITDDIGAVDHEIFNNELYIVNTHGLYKLTNDVFVELSEDVRPNFKGAVLMSTSGEFYARAPSPVYGFGMFKLANYLLCGPLNANGALRGDEALADSYTGNYYLVYDIEKDVWTSWQFSANSSTGPVSGPVQKPMPAAQDANTLTAFIWIGQTFYNGGLVGPGIMVYAQSAFRMANTGLVVDPGNAAPGVDIGASSSGVAIYKWIGGHFRTISIDLGLKNRFKRIFNAMLSASFSAKVFSVGSSKLGYLLNGATGVIYTPSITVQANRLMIGGGYRAHSFAVGYDSISGTVGNNTNVTAELTNLRQMTLEFENSQKDIA